MPRPTPNQITFTIDGREVSSDSEAWRHECEARAIAALPTLAERRAWLGDIERRNRARINHQMLHPPRAPDRIQPNLTVVSGDSAQTPQRIVKSVAVEDRADQNRFVICLRFSKMAQQLCPAIGARLMLADCVKRCFHSRTAFTRFSVTTSSIA